MTTAQTGSPGLDRIQTALDRGDVADARRALLELSAQELELLSAEIGEPAVRRAQGTAARGPRRTKLGRVLVLPGVMGSMLDVTDPRGDTNRVWANYERLISGRLGDLALTPAGDPAIPGTQVRTAGIHHGSYLPLLMELDARWEVRSFAYDWRESLDRSAARLDGELRAFGAGGPVHIVAHSMGGLVSRTLAALFSETWSAIDDPGSHGRGGRLVMLGTPNRGSFDMARALVGVDPLVRRLALTDLEHDLDDVVTILATFPGLAHLLPSPTAEIAESAHARLYEEATWGRHPVVQGVLDTARAAHTRLETTIDPERLVYVAGYDRPTPYRVRIDKPGGFSFQETRDGDGRVPHELGLLDGVATYWVDAAHGDLAKSEAVLDAIADLLQRGATDRLPTTRPQPRGAVRGGWIRAVRTEGAEAEGDAEVAAISGAARGRAAGARPRLTPQEQVRLNDLILGDYLGRGGAVPADAPRPPAPSSPGGKAGQVTRLPVDVVWGDVTRVDADAYVAGHYIGVIPQNAELALDRVVSGVPRGATAARSDLVITQQSLRGMLRGALGEISLFPWGYPADRGKLVAIAGMGHPGTYSLQAQRRLTRELAFAVGALPNVQVVAMVMIGSGEGTLSISEAVRGLVEGLDDALLDSGAQIAPMRRLVIGERSRQRAIQIHAALCRAAAELDADARAHPGSVHVRLKVGETLIAGAGGSVSSEEALALLVEAGLRAARNPASSSTHRALEALIGQIPTADGLRRGVREGIRWEARPEAPDPTPGKGLPRFLVEPRPGEPTGDLPVRISFWQDDRSVRVAAIHSSATVPERVLRVQPAMVDDLVERLTDPVRERVGRLSDFLARLLVPSDFRELLRSGPFVFELDRPMARVQWELLAYEPGGAGAEEPLAVRTPLARQLRTAYSPPPMPPARPGRGLRALVIGDPGDPAARLDLPGARHEALAVARLLRERLGQASVDVLIGAPSVARTGDLRDIPPADWLDVLDLLTRGGYDLVHYAGHGDFDPVDPTRAGWLFAGGLITSGEIERLDEVPAIIVANACLSSQTAHTEAPEAALLPSIADEFFKLGVRNYIGTAWEVNDLGAERFATAFYDALLPGSGPGASFGEAVRVARRELWKDERLFGALWAAYQHYGDPAGEAVLPPLSA